MQASPRFKYSPTLSSWIASEVRPPLLNARRRLTRRQPNGIAAHNAFTGGEPRRVSHRVIPRTMFTAPQIATVGLTEEEAISAGHNCWCTVPKESVADRCNPFVTLGLFLSGPCTKRKAFR